MERKVIQNCPAKNKINPIGEVGLDLNWCLGIFMNGWMPLIGINGIRLHFSNKKTNWRHLACFIQRWTFFFLSIGVNILMIVSFYLQEKENKNNSTLHWNEWMDYIVTSFHSISTHLCLLTFVTNHWNELRLAMNEVEYCLIDSRPGRVYPRLRKIMPLAVTAVILMVNHKSVGFSLNKKS